MRISVTNRRGVANNAEGFSPRDLNSISDYQEAFRFDHSPIVFRNAYRRGDHFESCDCLYGDIDDGLTLEDFRKRFREYKYIIATSRNHQKEKNGKPACDRFHVYFPQLKPYTSADSLRADLCAMHAEFPFLDPAAKDAARLLFGNAETKVEYNPGKEYRPTIPQNDLPMATGHEFDHVKTDLEKQDFIPLFSTPEGRESAKRLLYIQKDRNRWHDMDSWIALRSALYREGFSLQDFIDLSWDGANCAEEWRNMKEDTGSKIATGGSIVAWCREIDPDFPRGLHLTPTAKNPEPSKVLVRPNGDIVPVEDLYFKEDPTHGRAADVVYERLKGIVIYEKHGFDRGAFYKRNAGTCYWEPLETVKTVIRGILEETADRMFLKQKEALGAEKGDMLKALMKKYFSHLQKARTNDFLKSVVSLFSERVLVSPRVPWNMTPEALPCLDRVVDFSGAVIRVRDANEGEYFVNPVPCNAIDIVSAGTSPRFERFISDLFIDKETRRTALHCLALCISGSPSKTAQVWNNWAGDGGKNTVFDFLRELIPGRIAMLKSAIIAAKGDSGEKRFGLASAEGKTGIFFDELSMEIDVNQVKALTGLSEIKGEKKGRDQYDFQQTWSLVILCNKLPKFRPADDAAFLARLIVLPFSSVFFRDEQDKENKIEHGVAPESLKLAEDKTKILAELMAERPAIIKTLIDAWIDCRDTNNKTPYRSRECMRAGERYRKENDEVERFYDDYLERSDWSSISYQKLEELWIESTGNKRFNGMRWLVESLTSKYAFIKRSHSDGKRILKGVAEKQDFGDKKEEVDPIPF